MDYKKAYILLAGVMSNAINEINKSNTKSQELENTLLILQAGLRRAEEMHVCSTKKTIKEKVENNNKKKSSKKR